jgi:hypothetical protein
VKRAVHIAQPNTKHYTQLLANGEAFIKGKFQMLAEKKSRSLTGPASTLKNSETPALR